MRWLLGISAVVLLAGCGGGGGSGTDLEHGPIVDGFAFTSASAVTDGRPIDPRFTCDGEDVSPALAWAGVPEGTAELALVLEDPDAPGATFTHWLVYDMKSSVNELSSGSRDESWTGYGPEVLREGENDFGDTGYGGPCPPGGEEHRYVYRLLVLDAPTVLEPDADRATFDDAVAPHVRAEARLTATYERQ